MLTATGEEEIRLLVPSFGYNPLVGAQPDGSWRSAPAAMVIRICTRILESAKERAFDEDAARMLMR